MVDISQRRLTFASSYGVIIITKTGLIIIKTREEEESRINF